MVTCVSEASLDMMKFVCCEVEWVKKYTSMISHFIAKYDRSSWTLITTPYGAGLHTGRWALKREVWSSTSKLVIKLLYTIRLLNRSFEAFFLKKADMKTATIEEKL